MDIPSLKADKVLYYHATRGHRLVERIHGSIEKENKHPSDAVEKTISSVSDSEKSLEGSPNIRLFREKEIAPLERVNKIYKFGIKCRGN